MHATDWDKYFARAALGIGGGKVFLVVADGEGIKGAHGATLPQMGQFFRDVLGATSEIEFDGGLSSEMVLRGANGPRRVNTTVPGHDAFRVADVHGERASARTRDR